MNAQQVTFSDTRLHTIQQVVRFQERGITAGKIISIANRLKIFFYLVLFAAIEMNISEWRDEIQYEKLHPA